MAQPTPYDRITNFQNDQALHPTDPYPAPDLDAECNAVKITTDEIIQNLSLIQRDDGEIANDSVGRDQLKDDVFIGFGAPAPWETGHSYVIGDTVFQDNAFWYCEVSHTSNVFITDFDAGYWTMVADFTAAATVGAVMYIGDVPPAVPTQGQQWFESDTGNTFVYYDDGDSSQWVHTNGAVHAGPVALQSYTVTTLPTASLFPASLIYVSNGVSNKRLAVSDGVNWRWPDGAIVS